MPAIHVSIPSKCQHCPRPVITINRAEGRPEPTSPDADRAAVILSFSSTHALSRSGADPRHAGAIGIRKYLLREGGVKRKAGREYRGRSGHRSLSRGSRTGIPPPSSFPPQTSLTAARDARRERTREGDVDEGGECERFWKVGTVTNRLLPRNQIEADPLCSALAA